MRFAYEEGMFAHTIDALSMAEELSYAERVAYHEAGHAAVGYALGLGCARIEMRTTLLRSPDRWSYSGASRISKGSGARIQAAADRGRYDPLLGAFVVLAAAGPAAELKYCRLNEAPPRTLGGSEDDHNSVDGVAKLLEMQAGRNRWAVRRLAWAGAWRLIERPEIWEAITILAQCLIELDFMWPDAETPHDHSSFEILPGAAARAIMRRCGVQPLER